MKNGRKTFIYVDDLKFRYCSYWMSQKHYGRIFDVITAWQQGVWSTMGDTSKMNRLLQMFDKKIHHAFKLRLCIV